MMKLNQNIVMQVEYNFKIYLIRLMFPSFLVKIMLHTKAFHRKTGIISNCLRWSLSDPVLFVLCMFTRQCLLKYMFTIALLNFFIKLLLCVMTDCC